MDAKNFAIDPEDDLTDVEESEMRVGDGDEPIDYADEDLYHVLLGADVDLIESADVAFQATLDALNEEADTYEYEAHEADEVMALTVGQLVAQMAQNALLDSHGHPAAAAHAVLHALSKVRVAIESDIGPEAVPAALLMGDEMVLDPT
jgi:hypothetical protein